MDTTSEEQFKSSCQMNLMYAVVQRYPYQKTDFWQTVVTPFRPFASNLPIGNPGPNVPQIQQYLVPTRLNSTNEYVIVLYIMYCIGE